MKKIVFVLFLFAYISCFTQTNIKGFIYDETTNKPLPYAAVILGNTGFYTITNEDGAFEIKDTIVVDSLELKHIGFESKKVPRSYFKNKSILYLTSNVSQLDEITVVAYRKYRHKSLINRKTNPYKLLNDLIRKYRRKKLVLKSKAFFSLNSSNNNIPVELIEGFYNSNQSLSDGLIDLKIKSGRFGQNKSFPFYSLDNTTILKDFTLFKKKKQILPSYPGNLTFNSIKKKYSLKTDECKSCNEEDISISFVPKKVNGRLFSGKIILVENELRIKRLELWIKDSISIKVISIDKNDSVIAKEIRFNINFDPIDFEKIQYLDFTFNMMYHSQSLKIPVQSHSFLYFYENNNSFEEPYFTNPIHFNNDYDKIIALQASDDFWKLNYPFPQSNSYYKSMDYFKNNGYLFNYENYIPTEATPYISHSVIAWDKNKRLDWNSIKDNFDKSKPLISIGWQEPNHLIDEKLNFIYMLDLYRNEIGNKKFITRTLLDRNTSFYKKNRTKDGLVYINLMFDIFEYHRQSLNAEIKNYMTFEEVKRICDIKYIQALTTLKRMQYETDYGLNIENLILWTHKVKSELNN